MRTILVVDDDAFLREMVSDSLRYEGFFVIEANGANAALRILEVQDVDLVLSDIQMPDGDGFELLRRLRLRHPSIPPLIFVSGNPNVTESEVVALGAIRFFEKPFISSDLVSAVRFLLGA